MKKIIYDCDNTMGVKNRDVDDALTAIYLIGRNDVELLGITTTFGNDSNEVVYQSTQKLLNDIDRTNIPLVKGGILENRLSEAAEYLAESVNKYQGKITILATGALTNLYGAALIDPGFFDKVQQIVLMGGILEPLLINGHQVDELNFSSDPEATFQVLKSSASSTVITGHLCLNALFGQREFQRLESEEKSPIYGYIYENSKPWAEFFDSAFSCGGFYNWDVVAGVYTTQPELFQDNVEWVVSTADDLISGLLKVDHSKSQGYQLNIPNRIHDINKFNDLVFETWKNVLI